jgi:type IV secretory pathway VirB10-like protein
MSRTRIGYALTAILSFTAGASASTLWFMRDEWMPTEHTQAHYLPVLQPSPEPLGPPKTPAVKAKAKQVKAAPKAAKATTKQRKPTKEQRQKIKEMRDQVRLDREVEKREQEGQILPSDGAEDRASKRLARRQDAMFDLIDRLDRHAQASGWDDNTFEVVSMHIVDTSDLITEAIRTVDPSKSGWLESKADIRQFRVEMATELEQYLGPEEFGAFVDAMDFERFNRGEEKGARQKAQ